jgi:cobalt-zinc-cadmium resistance protein CzcA
VHTATQLAIGPGTAWPERDLVNELAQRLHSHISRGDVQHHTAEYLYATEIATGSSADLAVIISGPDLSRLRRLAGEMLDVLRTVPGASDTSIE